MTSFYKPVILKIGNKPTIVYPCIGLEKVLDRTNKKSIETHLINLYGSNKINLDTGEYHILILWDESTDDPNSESKDIMSDVWIFDKTESWGAGPLVDVKTFRNILTQENNKPDFEDIMNNKKILICNLSKGKIGEDTAYFLGGLFTAKIQLTALRRVHIKESERPDFFLYIDEFQNFATMSFAQILSEARKYRLSVILAHQNTVQIEPDLLETIIGNTGTLICFRTTSPKDEIKLLPVFAPEVEVGQIPNLPSYNFYMKINAIQPQATFSGEIENFVIADTEKIRAEVMTHSQQTYGNERSTITLSKETQKEKKTPKTVKKLQVLRTFLSR